jgi:hypothetical protein
MSRPPHIAWDKGGEAWVLALDADAMKLFSTIPSPPGSRLEGRAGGEVVRFKIHVCRAEKENPAGGPPGFVLEGRPLDMRKSVREALQNAIG